MFSPRVWIDIDLKKLVQNYRTACSLTKAEVTCVLKSNAYGHGIIPVAQALHQAGCRSYAVSCIREALLLRKNGITGNIMNMGVPEEALLEKAVAEEITLTVTSKEDVLQCCKAAEHIGKKAILHVKLDTGFHRLGFDCCEETVTAFLDIKPVTDMWADLEGIYSHFGLVNKERDIMQHDNLLKMCALFQQAGYTFRCVHICDSIGLVRYPDWHHDRVRVGAFLFGVRPARSEHLPFDDPETLTFCTRVGQVRDVAAGEVIGYGDEQIFDHPVKAATLCAGYGDGYPRRLSYGKAEVIIRGHRCKIIGLICMDQCMVDVSDVPAVQPGDTAILLGGGVSYMEYCDWAHTNRNEVITAMTNRPPRIYHDGTDTALVVDELLHEEEYIAESLLPKA